MDSPKAQKMRRGGQRKESYLLLLLAERPAQFNDPHLIKEAIKADEDAVLEPHRE
jgi:hypothetical protein